MSVPTFLRDRHAYWLKLTLRFRMKFFVALLADTEQLTLSCVRIPDGQGQFRSIREVLYVMHNGRFSVSFFLVFASLAFVPVQSQNIFAPMFPDFPAVEQIRRSHADEFLQSGSDFCHSDILQDKTKSAQATTFPFG